MRRRAAVLVALDIEIAAAAGIEARIVAVILVGGRLGGTGVVVPLVHVPGFLGAATGAAPLVRLAGVRAATQHVAQAICHQQATGDTCRGGEGRAHEAATSS